MRGRDPRIHFLSGRLSVSGLKRGEREGRRAWVKGCTAGVCFDLDGFSFFLVSRSLDEKNPFSLLEKVLGLFPGPTCLLSKCYEHKYPRLLLSFLEEVCSLLLLCFFDLLASEFYSYTDTRYPIPNHTTVRDIYLHTTILLYQHTIYQSTPYINTTSHNHHHHAFFSKELVRPSLRSSATSHQQPHVSLHNLLQRRFSLQQLCLILNVLTNEVTTNPKC